jgi:type I restriction enzyme S subunit
MKLLDKSTELPIGWEITKIGKFAEVIMGQSPPSDTYNNEKIGLPFFQGKAEFTDLHPAIKKWCSEPNKIGLPNDILVSVRAPVGSVNIANVECCIGRGLSAIRYIECNKFLFYFFKHIEKKLDEQGTGTTFRAISGEVLKNFPIYLPPVKEQHRIVAKIETLFSELDKGIESFKTAREQLKIYRQSLLKHAFSGKLTEQWRAENPDKLENAQALLQRIETERQQRYQQQLKDWKQSKSPPAPLFQRGGQATKLQQTGVVAHNTIPPFEKGGLGGISKPKLPKALPPLTAEELAALPELPEGWAWCRLGEFIDSIDAGKSFKCDEREPNQNEIGVAKVSAVTWGEYDESESKTCIDPSKINPNYFVAQNDFILSRANTIDLVGACVIARKVTKRIMLSDKTLRINFDGFNQKYFLQYLRSRFGRKQIMELSTGNQESMRNIGQERIQSIIVPICSTSESDYVVDSLDSKLSQIDQLDQTITTALQQAEALRQSILKKAFSGQLVPQDPSDEPASVLLERIRVEKAQADIQPVRRRGKTS